MLEGRGFGNAKNRPFTCLVKYRKYGNALAGGNGIVFPVP